MEGIEIFTVVGQAIDIDNTAETIGRTLVAVPMLIGLIVFARWMRRPEVQSLGPLALILMLLGMIGSIIFSLLGEGAAPIKILLGAMMPLFYISALIVAIISLVLFARNRERYTSGRVSAITAIVICGLMVTIMIGAFIVGLARRNLAAERLERAEQVLDLNPGLAAEPKRFEELNFEFDAPGKPWYSLSPKLMNPAASLVYRRTGDGTIFLIIAERGGVDLDLDSNGLAEIAGANAEAALDDPTLDISGEVEVNGMNFKKIAVSGKASGKRVHQHYYVIERNGFLYQLMTVSTNGRQGAENGLAEMAKLFRQVDPEAVCYSTGHAFSEPVVIAELGLTAKLEGTGWATWDTLATEFPEADFGAMFKNYGMLGLVSFDLRTHEVTDEELAAACTFVLWGNTVFPDALDQVEPFESGGLKGIDMRTTHEISGETLLDKIRVFQHEGRGWAQFFWLQESMADRFDEIAGVLEKIEPGPASVPESEANLSAQQIAIRGTLFNRLGLNCYEKNEFARAAEFFRTAVELRPDDETFLLNVAYAIEEQQLYQEAADYLDENLSRFPNSPEVAVEIAWNLEQAGETEAAIERYGAAFDQGSKNEDYLLNYLNLLVAEENFEGGMDAVATFHEDRGSDRTLRWKADMLTRLDRYPEAIELLTARYETKPFDSAVAYDLAEFHLAQDAADACLEICARLIEEDEETWDVAWLRGQAYMAKERYRDAKSAFEFAVELNPDNPDLKHSLARASSALGEGNNSLIRVAIEPVEIASELQQLLDASPVEPDDESYGAQVLSRVRMIHHKPGEPLRETNYTRVRITGERGVEAFKTFKYDFDPFAERLFVNRVEVRGEDGEIIAEGKLEDFYVMDSGDETMATENQVLNVAIPGLRPGVTLDVAVSREHLGAAEQFQFASHVFFDSYPSQHEAFGVVGDVSGLKVVTEGDFEEVKDEQLLAWAVIPPALVEFEANQPARDKFLPTVWISDAQNTWEALAADYFEKLGDLLTEVSPEIEATANRIAGAQASEEETVRKLANFVRSELTYKAIEFGPRGRIPVEATRTLRNRYGDCKEHSFLLHHLLKARGIESHLALADFNDRVQADLADLDQFSHMILWVPAFRGGRFVDCTDDYLEAGDFPPDHLGGTNALILEPGAVRVQEIPTAGADSRRFEISRILSIEGGDLNVAESAEFKGYAASRLRAYFAVRDRKSHKTAFQRTFDFPGFRVKSVDAIELENPDLPFRITAKYTLANAVKPGRNGAVELPLPSTWELLYLDPDYVHDRRSPFELEDSITVRTELTWATTDQKWELAGEGDSKKTGSSDFGVWAQEVTDSGAKLVWTFERGAGLYPAERYEEFVEDSEAAIKIWERAIQLRRPEAAE